MGPAAATVAHATTKKTAKKIRRTLHLPLKVPITGEVPDGALTLEWARVVRDAAVHGEATGWTNREGHGSLAERHILGGGR